MVSRFLVFTRRRSAFALALVILAMGFAFIASGSLMNGSASAQAPADAESVAVRQAEALARQPKLFSQVSEGALVLREVPGAPQVYNKDTIEEGARQIAATVPFPPGLNSASNLNWDEVVGGGLGATSISDPEVRRIIQANALRDWAWYAANRGLTAKQRAVIATIADWSAFRDQPGKTPHLAQNAADLGQTPEGRAYAARFFGESDGQPRPARW